MTFTTQDVAALAQAAKDFTDLDSASQDFGTRKVAHNAALQAVRLATRLMDIMERALGPQQEQAEDQPG